MYEKTTTEKCEQWVLEQVISCNGSIAVADLADRAARAGYLPRTIRNAKDALKSQGFIDYFQTGNGNAKKWHVRLDDRFKENPEVYPDPGSVCRKTLRLADVLIMKAKAEQDPIIKANLADRAQAALDACMKIIVAFPEINQTNPQISGRILNTLQMALRVGLGYGTMEEKVAQHLKRDHLKGENHETV